MTISEMITKLIREWQEKGDLLVMVGDPSSYRSPLLRPGVAKVMGEQRVKMLFIQTL